MEPRQEASEIIAYFEALSHRTFHTVLSPVIVSLLAVGSAIAFPIPQKYGNENQEEIVRLTFDCQFNKAMNIAESLSKEHPDSIKWEFFRSVIFWQESVCLDSAGLDGRCAEEAFRKCNSEVIKIGEHRLANNSNDSSSLFYTGFALGYLAKLDAANGNEFKAASDGNMGLTYHRMLLKICPDRYDALFSLALFNYYTGFLPWYLRPILFILGKSGSKEKALEYLNLVRRKGSIVRYEADDILGEFYGRVNKPDSVEIVYHRLISVFPEAALHYYDKMTWVLMDSKHYRREEAECENAVKASQTLKMNPLDSSYLGKIYLRLASCYHRLGLIDDATRTYRAMIALRITPDLESSAHFQLGRLYEESDDRLSAVREYELVVRRTSQPVLAREARECLGRLGIR